MRRMEGETHTKESRKREGTQMRVREERKGGSK